MADAILHPDYRTHEHLLPSSRVNEAIARLELLSRTAERLGLPPFDIKMGEPVLRKVPGGGNQYDRYVPVRFVGGPPKLGGWRFVAKLEHAEDGNLIKTMRNDIDELRDADGNLLTKRMFDCPPSCEHCDLNRNRKVTFFFRHDDERIMQVGSSCVADFSGHSSPESVLVMAGVWCEYLDYVEHDPDEKGGPSRAPYYEVTDALAAAASTVRTVGYWVSAKNAEFGEASSADLIRVTLQKPGSFREHVTAVDVENAKAALEWLRSDSFEVDGNTYYHNLKVLSSREHVSDKNLSLLCSGITAWHRALKVPGSVNGHVSQLESLRLGAEGDKIELTVRVEKKVPTSSNWGTSMLCIMRDLETNARVVWFNSGMGKFFEGEQYRIQGRVAGYEMRNGVWQTKLGRVSSPDLKLHELAKDGSKYDQDAPAKLKKAIKKAVHIDARDCRGETALLLASRHYDHTGDDRDCVLHLLEAGANPSIDDNDARLPMCPFDHWVAAGDVELVERGLRDRPELATRWDERRLSDFEISPEVRALIDELRPEGSAAEKADSPLPELEGFEDAEDKSRSLGLA